MTEARENFYRPVSLTDGLLPSGFQLDPHYEAIAAMYGERTTARSGVPLINHIKEGLYVLNVIGADLPTQRAYALHPIFQGDSELARLGSEGVAKFDPWVVALVMEYRSVANDYLSTRPITALTEIRLSPLPQVQQMLVADKVQNRKDFEAYHKGTHPRSVELERYFQNWFERLGISEEFYSRMVRELAASHFPFL